MSGTQEAHILKPVPAQKDEHGVTVATANSFEDAVTMIKRVERSKEDQCAKTAKDHSPPILKK